MNLPTTTLRFIFHFVRQSWFKFSIITVAAAFWAVNDTFFPYFIKRMVNILGNSQGDRAEIYTALSGILITLVIFWLLAEILLRLQGIVSSFTYPTFRAQIREEVFKYVQSHSHEYFSNQFAGNMAKKISDLPSSCQNVMEIITFNFVTVIVGTIIVLFMMYSVDPIFAGILLIWMCGHLGAAFLFLRYGHKAWEVHADSVSVLSGKIVDAFNNMLNVRLFARKPYELDYLKKFQDDEVKKGQKAYIIMELSRFGMGISGLFLIFAMMFTLIEGWIQGWVTLGDFTQVGMQTFWLLGLMWMVSYQLHVFVREMAIISDSLSLIRECHDVVDKKQAPILIAEKGNIKFQKVDFAYRKNRPVFTELNVTIPAGQKVGLVGFSGSGKSTFVNLILRFYDIQAGKILIDDQNIADVTQESLRNNIAMIPQDPALFHRTLMENLRYGRLDATDEEVIHASKLAHCHEFIEKLEDGYYSMVGERGIKLSGGQRQRIAIARAMLKNVPILILDEATSSLDSVTEKLIQESLRHLMQGKTTLVIAHRLSTLNNMDRLLVFSQGQIIEDGTQEELLRTPNSHFAQLWNMQMNGFLPEKE